VLTLDIFKDDAFGVMSLTTLVNEIPFTPGQAGATGVFTEEGVTTTAVAIENDKGTLRLVPNTPRSAPSNQNTRNVRTLRYFRTLHLPQEDTVTNDEVQNVRPLPGQGLVQTAQAVLAPKMRRMVQSNDATIEYGRVGALSGIILDSDGATVIYNLFTEFGIAQPTFDMLLGTPGQSQLTNGTNLANLIENILGYTPYTKLMCFCGATFWQRFITHPSVVDAYLYFQATNGVNPLKQDLRYVGFEHGGITYVQYRGNIGGVPFIPAAEAQVFPVGVPELFKTFFAPANYLETANTMGQPRYAKFRTDPSGYNKYLPFEVQSNPITICTRPGVLYQLFSSN